MSKTLNKSVQFVKVDQIGILKDIPYRVKSFREKESIVVIDKKATTIKNENLTQDTECYAYDKKVKLEQAKKKR